MIGQATTVSTLFSCARDHHAAWLPRIVPFRFTASMLSLRTTRAPFPSAFSLDLQAFHQPARLTRPAQFTQVGARGFVAGVECKHMRIGIDSL